jgi:death-on-curing protein
MAEPRWLERAVVDAIYADQLQQHGGRPGVRDENALESALARPRHKWAYDPAADLAMLAAAYGYGLATSHPYTDGNKRIALLAMYVFLGLNGRELEAPEPEVVSVMLAVADHRCSEAQLAEWIRERAG